MNTNTGIWIATAAVLVFSATTVFWQRRGISATRGEIETLRRAIAEQEEPPRDLAASPPGAPPIETAAHPSAPALLAMLPPAGGDMAEFFRSVPAMFEQIRDHSPEELLALIAEIDGGQAEDDGKAGFVKTLLMMIVAEDAPEEILAMVEESGNGRDGGLRAAAFVGLAKKDPDRARQMLDTVDWPAREVQNARTSLFRALLQHDLPAALELFRDSQSDLLAASSGVISDVSSDPSLRAEIWEAARVEGDAVLRQELVRGLLIGDYIRGGAAAMRASFAAAEFLDGELKRVLIRELAPEAMASQPDETVLWIRESLPADEIPAEVARAVGSWAREDFNAAGTWLGAQENSPERDAAISTFAKTVARIDPQAAATWANSIEDAAARRKALAATLGRWRESDAAAAIEWAQENGIDVGDIPSVSED